MHDFNGSHRREIFSSASFFTSTAFPLRRRRNLRALLYLEHFYTLYVLCPFRVVISRISPLCSTSRTTSSSSIDRSIISFMGALCVRCESAYCIGRAHMHIITRIYVYVYCFLENCASLHHPMRDPAGHCETSNNKNSQIHSCAAQ